MDKLEYLNVLYEKYKKSRKPNQHDSEEAKQIILELLRNQENIDSVIKYIILLPEEVGIDSYVQHYKTLDRNARKQLNQLFANSEEFKANTSGRSVNRATYLIGLFCKSNLIMEAKYMLMKLVSILVSNKSKTIPDKYIEVFRKNILNNYYKEFFTIQLEQLKDKYYYRIQETILIISFSEVKDEIVKPIIQYGTLVWLSNSNRDITFNDDEKKMVQGSISKWPKDFIVFVKNDIEFMKTYGHQLVINEETSKEVLLEQVVHQDETDMNSKITSEEKSEVDDVIKIQDAVKIKELGLKDILVKALNETKKIEEELNNKDKKIESFRQSLEQTQRIYEEKLRENKQLFSKIEELKTYIEELQTKNEISRRKLEMSEEEKLKMVIEQKENKNKIVALLDMSKNEESSALEEYKNKLSSKLKHMYNDFKETESYPMSEKYGENLRDQMRELFNVLINQDIEI